MQKIILASQSKARKVLFDSLGISFTAIPAHIDERRIRDPNLKVRAEKIARTKAEKIASVDEGIVIACDTFSECEGRVFEKPIDKKEAKKMLMFLSEKNAVSYTGFCYIDSKNDIDFSTTVSVSYTFRTLYKSEIEEYVSLFPVTEWAAGFALITPYINTFISSMSGSYTGIAYGVPTELLIPLLKQSGFEPKPVS